MGKDRRRVTTTTPRRRRSPRSRFRWPSVWDRLAVRRFLVAHDQALDAQRGGATDAERTDLEARSDRLLDELGTAEWLVVDDVLFAEAATLAAPYAVRDLVIGRAAQARRLAVHGNLTGASGLLRPFGFEVKWRQGRRHSDRSVTPPPNGPYGFYRCGHVGRCHCEQT